MLTLLLAGIIVCLTLGYYDQETTTKLRANKWAMVGWLLGSVGLVLAEYRWPHGELAVGVLSVALWLLLWHDCWEDLFFQTLEKNKQLTELSLAILLAVMLYNDISESVWQMMLPPAGYVLLISTIRWLGRKFYQQEAIGNGDVGLAAVIGLVTSWHWVIAFLTLFPVMVLLTLPLLARLIRQAEEGFKATAPFGPYMIIPGWGAYYFGEQLFNWWMNIF